MKHLFPKAAPSSMFTGKKGVTSSSSPCSPFNPLLITTCLQLVSSLQPVQASDVHGTPTRSTLAPDSSSSSCSLLPLSAIHPLLLELPSAPCPTHMNAIARIMQQIERRAALHSKRPLFFGSFSARCRAPVMFLLLSLHRTRGPERRPLPSASHVGEDASTCAARDFITKSESSHRGSSCSHSACAF